MMNKILCFLLAILLIAAPAFGAKSRWYNATSLTGGATNALDAINGQNLSDGDKAIVITTADTYHFNLDSDASGTETSPGVINPDSNAGTKSWMLVFGPLETDNSDNATSGTGEDDMASTTIPKNVMGTGKGLRIVAAGTITGANDTKTVKLHFGGSSYSVISAAAGDTTDWRIEAVIYNTAAGAQRITWKGLESDGTETSGYEAAAVDTTAAVTLKLTGTCASASDTITQTMWDVRLY
jgi:hypothetical protein